MTISFDACTTAKQNAGVNLSFAHIVSGTNRLLLVALSYRAHNNPAATASAVTYGGVALTKIRRDANTDENTELWYLIDPPIGSNMVVITWSADPEAQVAATISYKSVDQLTPLGNNAGNTGNSNTQSVVIVSSVGELCVAVAATYPPFGIMIPGAGVAERWEVNSADGNMKGTGGEKAGAASVTLQWTNTNPGNWAMSAVALKPAITTVEVRTISRDHWA